MLPVSKENDVGSAERREREKKELRQRILDAARELFAKQGFEAVTMRAIADRIEYSPTAIYIHFKDKNALVRELCEQDFGLLSKRLGGLDKIVDPMDRIRRVGLVYADFALEHPNHYRLLFMTPGLPGDLATEERKNPEEDAYFILVELVRQARDAGLLRPELKSEHLVAQLLWASIHGVVSLEIAKHDNEWIPWVGVKQRIKTVIDVMIRGLSR